MPTPFPQRRPWHIAAAGGSDSGVPHSATSSVAAQRCSTTAGPSSASFTSLSTLVSPDDDDDEEQQQQAEEHAKQPTTTMTTDGNGNSHPINAAQTTQTTLLILPVGTIATRIRSDQEPQQQQQRVDRLTIPPHSSLHRNQSSNCPASLPASTTDGRQSKNANPSSSSSSSAIFTSFASSPPPPRPSSLLAVHDHQCFSSVSGSPLSTAGSIGSILSATSTSAANNNDNGNSGDSGGISNSSSNSSRSGASQKSRIFPSTRFVIALLLCLCFVSLSISTSNISVSMVCMVRRTKSQQQREMTTVVPMPSSNGAKENSELEQQRLLLALQGNGMRQRRQSANIGTQQQQQKSVDSTAHATTATGLASEKLVYHHQRECDEQRVRKHVGNGTRQKRLTVIMESCHEADKLAWTPTDEGIVFAAQNAGSLFMLFTGAHADRLNSKWTITGALALLVLGNALLPWVASTSVWLVVGARVLTGLSDALLQPSTSSLITRWFPPKERPFAIGLITGGRQIGTLMILPLAGFLCSRPDIAGGWPAIFHLSALIGAVILFIWLLMAADKPSKHCCTSHRERCFVEEKIAEERLGKRTERRAIPWRRLASCRPLYVGVAALICHEYPLVIMLQLLPKYINDVLHLSNVKNGFVSALPIAVLFIAKTVSATASSYIQARKKGRFQISRTPLAKWFNGVASLGLGVCVGIVPLLNADHHLAFAIVVLCLANAFAGLHTPGVQTALLQIAPAYTGIITGIAFGCVAIVSIANKILSNFILQEGSLREWTIVYWISAVIALLPVVFFTLWGSADRQPWASFSVKSVLSQKNSQIVVIGKRGGGKKVFPTTTTTTATISDCIIGKGKKKKSIPRKKASTVTTMTIVNGSSGIFVLDGGDQKKRQNEQFGFDGAEHVEEDHDHEEHGEGEEEHEDEDAASGTFHPEAAVASALRLQMFLEHPEANNAADDDEEDDDNHWAQCLQAQAWQVGQIARKVSNASDANGDGINVGTTTTICNEGRMEATRW